MGDTNVAVPAATAAACSSAAGNDHDATRSTTKAIAATSIPRPIFMGEEGSLPFLANAPKMIPMMGVSATTKQGLNC